MIHARNARPHPTLETDHGDDWRARAACLDHDPELWFSDQYAERDRAYSICRNCPAKDACKKAGKPERFGIWGGESREPKRRNEKPRFTPCPVCQATQYTSRLHQHTREAHGVCPELHDLTKPNARNKRGQCRTCQTIRNRVHMRGKRGKSECVAGHDLDAEGARYPNGDCRACRLDKAAIRRHANQDRVAQMRADQEAS